MKRKINNMLKEESTIFDLEENLSNAIDDCLAAEAYVKDFSACYELVKNSSCSGPDEIIKGHLDEWCENLLKCKERIKHLKQRRKDLYNYDDEKGYPRSLFSTDFDASAPYGVEILVNE